MCGRYTAGRHRPEQAEKALADLISREWPDLAPRYNVSPGTNIPLIRQSSENGAELTELKWGLLPYWCKEPRVAYNTINAMAETVETNASYRIPFRKRRCLIPADGWYEWQPLNSGKQKRLFHKADDTDFCFAGLWDRWQRGDQIIDTCSLIVTTLPTRSNTRMTACRSSSILKITNSDLTRRLMTCPRSPRCLDLKKKR